MLARLGEGKMLPDCHKFSSISAAISLVSFKSTSLGVI